jgi:hypothetical protein
MGTVANTANATLSTKVGSVGIRSKLQPKRLKDLIDHVDAHVLDELDKHYSAEEDTPPHNYLHVPSIVQQMYNTTLISEYVGDITVHALLALWHIDLGKPSSIMTIASSLTAPMKYRSAIAEWERRADEEKVSASIALEGANIALSHYFNMWHRYNQIGTYSWLSQITVLNAIDNLQLLKLSKHARFTKLYAVPINGVEVKCAVHIVDGADIYSIFVGRELDESHDLYAAAHGAIALLNGTNVERAWAFNICTGELRMIKINNARAIIACLTEPREESVGTDEEFIAANKGGQVPP